jgi:hypothetical protein
VRKAFGYEDPAWEELADQFNRLAWMIKIHVLLVTDDMDGVATIADITDMIFTKANANVAFVASLPTTTELRAQFKNSK